MFANAGPSGEPMATPWICRYMLLLKLNSTEEVASCIDSTKMSRGKDGWGKSLLYRASAQICMVSASGTLVKRLEMSKERRKTDEGEKVKFLTSSTKVKESDTQLADRSWRTGWRRQVSHLASSCWVDPVIDRIGRKGTSFLYPLKSVRRKALGWISYFTPKSRCSSICGLMVCPKAHLPALFASVWRYESRNIYGKQVKNPVALCE